MSEIHNAAKLGEVATILNLIASGKDVNSKDKLKRTPLHLASWSGHVEVMETLLRAKADVNAKAGDDFMPLHFCAQNGHTEGCALLLKHGAKVGAKVSKTLRTPLHIAAAKGHAQICALLLKSRANPLQKTKNGETPLDLAGNESVTEVLNAALGALGDGNQPEGKEAAEEDDVHEGDGEAAREGHDDAAEGLAVGETDDYDGDRREKDGEHEQEGEEIIGPKRPVAIIDHEDAPLTKKPKAAMRLSHLEEEDAS